MSTGGSDCRVTREVIEELENLFEVEKRTRMAAEQMYTGQASCVEGTRYQTYFSE